MVSISLDPNRLYLFDPATGNRIGKTRIKEATPEMTPQEMEKNIVRYGDLVPCKTASSIHTRRAAI